MGLSSGITNLSDTLVERDKIHVGVGCMTLKCRWLDKQIDTAETFMKTNVAL